MRHLLLLSVLLQAACWQNWVKAGTSEETMKDDWRECQQLSDPGRPPEADFSRVGQPLHVRPAITPSQSQTMQQSEQERRVREYQCMQGRGYRAASRSAP
jgi:hypothetical protein